MLVYPTTVSDVQNRVVQKRLCQVVSSARLQPAQAGHARLVLNKTVNFLRTTLYRCTAPFNIR